ncbi:hypothetical protein [Roseococcus sp.]|uniref:hypothetical protein n=1 Tax=Roseococcus sp. TaxID=2109646 RepID=UPI003BABB21F
MEEPVKSQERQLSTAEHIALQALGPYDAEPLAPPPRARRRPRLEEGRLIRLALLPLAGWCLGVLFDLSVEEILCAVLVATLVAATIALRR